MDETERKIRQRLKDDFEHYAKKCLKIRTKNGDIKPLILNKAQQYIHKQIEQQKLETKKVRCILLKGRQQGASTLIEARFFWLVTHRIGVRAFILTHDIDATNNLFEMAHRYYQFCPTPVRPTIDTSNAKEFLFRSLDSGYKLGTAGNKAVGRSSTIQLLHGSEVGYWPNAREHAKGIMQAVPNEPGTEIIMESTANGIGNYFHEQWQQAETGQSDFLPIFVPWFWQDEYAQPVPLDFSLYDEEKDLVEIFKLTNEQVMWRRLKIAELSMGGSDGRKSFCQEYPCTAQEAFQTSGDDSFILASNALHARKCDAEKYGALILGVDPARFGNDRTSIIRRRGRVAYGLNSYIKKDTMEVTGLVHQIICEEHPDKVCVDIGGLGAGVYDRLKELGHGEIIVAVNGGAVPYNAKKYYNKRAEMWGEMKEWLLDTPVSIPDTDSLHADLCGISYKYDSKSRLVLEKKEDMKRRGLRSPDEADALALTFAIPSNSFIKSKAKENANIARTIMSEQQRIDRLKKRAYAK